MASDCFDSAFPIGPAKQWQPVGKTRRSHFLGQTLRAVEHAGNRRQLYSQH